MWLFKKDPEDLAKHGKLGALLYILAEPLPRHRDLDKCIAATSAMRDRKELAASLFKREAVARTSSGQTASSLGLASKMDTACDRVIAINDEDSAILFGIAIWPIRDPDARSVLRKLLLSEVGWNVWRALCGREGPEVLDVLLPLIPDYEKIGKNRLHYMLEDLEHSFQAFDKAQFVPASFLLPLIFLNGSDARTACSLLQKFMTPRTVEEQVLAAILQDPVDQGVLDRLGTKAIPYLRKFKEAIATSLPEKADTQLKRLNAPVTARDKVIALLTGPAIGTWNTPKLSDEEGDVLLEFMTGESAQRVAKLLVGMKYPKAAVPVLTYVVRNVCREYSQLVHSSRNRGEVDGEFSIAVQAFGSHGRAFLKGLLEDEAIAAFWQETFGEWAGAFAPGLDESLKAVKEAAQNGLRLLDSQARP